MSQQSPEIPRFAIWILESVCNDDFLEEFQGDLEELYAERRNHRSALMAQVLLWRDVVSLLRNRFRKHRSTQPMSFQPVLLTSYFTVAWRGILRNKGFSFINIAGLGAGLACCLMIGLYIQDELSYDAFHENGDRIFRVTTTETEGGRTAERASTYFPLASTLQSEYAFIDKTTRVFPYSALLILEDQRQFQEDQMVFVDSSFLEMFSFEMRIGESDSALDQPFSLVLTESAANRYFGNQNPFGEVVSIRTGRDVFDFTITGVLVDMPANSHISFEIAASFSSLRTIAPHMFHWFWPPVYSYVMLQDVSAEQTLLASFPDFQSKYHTSLGIERDYGLQPLADVHLRSGLENEMGPVGSIRHVYLFALVAFLILLIGCINFTNLSTARSAGRAREVGMRKTLGAKRLQLAGQFLSESFVTAFISLGLGLILTWLLLPLFGSVTGKSFSFAVLGGGWNPVILVLLIAMVGLLTGSYPAFFLSSFRPILVLKGLVAHRGSAVTLIRRGLVVFQFAITSSLIVGTVVIQRQLDFLQNDRLGFDKEHVLVVPLRDMDNQINHESLKEAWTSDPRIVSVSASSGYPGYLEGLHDFIVVPEDAKDDSLSMLILTADHDFAETFGLEIVAGRDLSEEFETDASEGFLINESAAKKIGWTDPVGKKLTLSYYIRDHELKEGHVVGVVRDFQYMSFHRALDPIVFHVQENSFYNDFISVRLSGTDVRGAIAHLEEAWASFNPDRPFEYQFVDEVFDQMYRADNRLGKILGSFAFLAVLIACLGLFSLAAYTTEQRTREIGIRKAMGASISNVVVLLSRQFMTLVFVAFVLAIPISLFAMRYWLDGFAARINMGAGIFLLSGAIALLIGVLSVGYQSMRAATANPATSLRHE